LINLASNSAQAMRGGGHIQIALEEASGHLRLTFSDTGCGIPDSALETVFSAGYTTHVSLPLNSEADSWLAQHRGLGLPIVRSLVSAVGGLVWAASRNPHQDAATGATIVFQFPLSPGTGSSVEGRSDLKFET
jgi:signal transduction histidine kinase